MIKLDANNLIVLQPEDLKTPFVKRREMQGKEIVRQYEHLCKKHPEVSPTLFFAPIAEQVKMTRMGVRNYLIHAGLYSPRNKRRNHSNN